MPLQCGRREAAPTKASGDCVKTQWKARPLKRAATTARLRLGVLVVFDFDDEVGEFAGAIEKDLVRDIGWDADNVAR